MLYFLLVFSRAKINYHSIMDTVGISVPTRLIREFSHFSVSSALRHNPSARCVSAANDMKIFEHI
jgi:hypothetical protein